MYLIPNRTEKFSSVLIIHQFIKAPSLLLLNERFSRISVSETGVLTKSEKL